MSGTDGETAAEGAKRGHAAADGDATRSAPAVSLRVDLAPGVRIGPGKVALLEAVGRTGSISAAGRALGMSYRRAWTLVDALNRSFDGPVVSATAGGPGGGGAEVTPLGRDLVDAYRDLERRTASLAAERMAAVSARLSADPPPGPGAAADED